MIDNILKKIDAEIARLQQARTLLAGLGRKAETLAATQAGRKADKPKKQNQADDECRRAGACPSGTDQTLG